MDITRDNKNTEQAREIQKMVIQLIHTFVILHHIILLMVILLHLVMLAFQTIQVLLVFTHKEV